MSECVLWTGAVTKGGYGNRAPKGGGSWQVHRAIWEASHGKIAEGFEVHHKCGVKTCYNLDHLMLLSMSEHRSLHSKGGRNGRARLTEEKAICAMARLLAGEKQADVGASLGVSQSAISKLWLGKTWKGLFE